MIPGSKPADDSWLLLSNPRFGQRWLLICLTAAYIAALRLAYVSVIAPNFGYMHYGYRPATGAVELINWFLMLVPALWLPIDCRRPSEMVLWFLYLLVLVPSLLIPQYALPEPSSELLLPSLVLTVAFHIIGVAPKLPLLSVPRVNISAILFWSGFTILTACMYGVVLLAFGARFTVPSIANVYSTRFAYKAQLEQAGPFAGYAVFWLAEVINPILLAVGLTRRRYWLAGAAATGQLLLLATTAFKTIAVVSVLLAALVLMLRQNGKRLGYWMLGGSCALILVCLGLDRVAHTLIFTSVLVRRAIITPGLLTGLYYEYFSQHPPVMFASSFLHSLAQSPYALSPAQMIGATYFEGPQTNANANLWADAYANFRYAGVLFMTGVLVMILWLLDSVMADHRRKDAFLFVAVPAL